MNKVAGYKINIQKSLAFLYTNHEKTEREIKETIPLSISTKRIKYLGIYLPKETNGEGNGTPLQYSCLENPMDGGAWRAAVHGVSEGRTQLSDFTFTFMHWKRKWQPTPVFLPGESQGWGNLVGCRLWGRTESDTTKAT